MSSTGISESPKPGRSSATTRRSRERAGMFSSQLRQRPPCPWMSTSGGPAARAVVDIGDRGVVDRQPADLGRPVHLAPARLGREAVVIGFSGRAGLDAGRLGRGHLEAPARCAPRPLRRRRSAPSSRCPAMGDRPARAGKGPRSWRWRGTRRSDARSSAPAPGPLRALCGSTHNSLTRLLYTETDPISDGGSERRRHSSAGHDPRGDLRWPPGPGARATGISRCPPW